MEVGTAPDYGDNSAAQWIRDAFAYFGEQTQLKGVVWFNDRAFESPTGMDFRVAPDNPALGPVPTDRTDAFRAAALDWVSGLSRSEPA